MSGHAGPAPVADISTESFPEYGTSIQDGYVDGYDPVSLGAPHSSLVKHITWVGMALILASLAGFGTLIYGAATTIWGHGASEDISEMLLIVGGILTAVTLIGGFITIHAGRSGYRKYRKATGRRN
ncbi:hypothetical protein [Corynebacterium sp. p3-SID1194]|uniref:hypothetical protein n=1 Tax=Corynebacterium sp. p3-SID1194 TaxID=2916105 RepID=UPI0021A2A3FA|nr:hypothetical protein [Corynebacterium sp. p3-SID1194]MCT1449658.1 hypothetical protein [Corynebacterium sp. p3-SID1194]